MAAPRRLANRLARTAPAVVVLVLAACGGDDDHRGEYSSATRSEFLELCETQGEESAGYCRCAFDIISERLSPAEYDALLAADRAGAGFPGLPDGIEDEVRETLGLVEDTCR